MSEPPRRFGGIGALFFIASLGAIAFYVQKQEIPEERDLVRASATVLTEERAQEEPIDALPWRDRLDLTAAALVPIGPARAPAADGSEAFTYSGIPEQAVNLRWRDGTMYQSFATDLTGFVPFDEVFPFFSWLVAEVDFARFLDVVRAELV